jgi:hypothetical protein
MMNGRIALAALLALLMLPAAASAAGAKRVGVPKFEGAQEALVRKQVMQVLKAHGYELAKSREMEAAMSNAGVLLESDDGFQKVAKELALTAVVTGEVGKKRAKIIVHDGREGSVLGEASFAGANPKKIAAEVGKGFWKQLGADVERGHTPSGSKKPKPPVAEAPEDDENAPEAAGAAPPPPEPVAETRSKKSKADIVADGPKEGEPEPEAAAPSKKKKKKKKAKDEDTGEEEEGGAATVPPMLDASVGFAGINRAYAYNQDASGLRPYGLPMGAAAVIKVVGYPLSLAMDGPIQNLGLELSIEQAFGIASSIGAGDTQFPTGATFTTSVHEFAGGARYRIPFGLSHQLWFSATGGEHAFVFKSASGCMSTNTCRGMLDIPDTIYRFVRPGVGARFEFGEFAVAATLGYRLIFNGAGNHFQTFFPHRTVGGIDAEAYVGYRMTDMIEVRAGLQFRRYFFSMHSVAADTWKAGGAIDQYLSGGVGVAFLFGGSERPEPAEEEEAPPPKKKKKKKAAEDEEAAAGEEGGAAE